jgi:tetratricopeptide (TPR) repeat protein
MDNGFAQTTALGFSRLGESHIKGAMAAFRRAMVIEPAQAIGSYGAGFCELRASNWRDATRLLSWAAKAVHRETPTRVSAEIHIALGHCRKSRGLGAGGRRCFRRATVVEPANAQIYYNHSNCLEGLAGDGFGPRLAKWAVTLAPGSANHWNNLGRSLPVEAAAGASMIPYRRALALNPIHPHAWNNLGNSYKRGNQLRPAIRCFRRAHLIDPTNERALLDLGRNLLLLENLADGWRFLEAPWRARGLQPRDGSFSLPVWDGSHLAGGRLLIWSEEKIGEEIMFSTMLKDVAQRAGPVTLLCNPRIARLLREAMPEIDVRGWAEGMPPPILPGSHAACYPLEFVGRFVRRSISEFPPAKPLLMPAKESTDVANNAPNRPARATVGLHWRSINPLVGTFKSIPLRDFGPILSTPGLDFVSLQYGPVSDEIALVREIHGNAPRAPVGIDQLSDMDAFTDLVTSLDLVISISGTSAHVAASLGRPTWVLLPQGPGLSWFWFEDRNTSPWYPNCRLYRQTGVGSWRDVVENVSRDLREWVVAFSA